jgi:small-conductance mechanosensitive channel
MAVTVADPAASDPARTALLAMMRDDPRIHREPAPDVFVETYGPNGTVLNCRAWASPEEFGAVQRTLIEGARRRIEALGEGRPAVKQIARVVPPDNDPSRLIAGGDHHGRSVELPADARLPDGWGDRGWD